MTNNDLDITTSQFSQNPYPIFEELRKKDNVHFLKKNDTWLILGYTDILDILSNPRIFSSENENPLDAFILNCDPPVHTHHRKILGGNHGIFSNNRIDNLAIKNREICRELLNNVSKRKEFDALNDFASQFSTLVVMGMLNISASNYDLLPKSSYVAVSNSALHNTNYANELWEKFKPIVDEWIKIAIKNKDSEGLSEIIFHKDLDGNVSHDTILNLVKLMLVAGAETTPSLITNALFILLKDKLLFDKVKANPELIMNVLNETLRLESPIQVFKRINKEEVTIGSNIIPANSSISLAVGAGNRDPAIFKDPDKFILERKDSKILSFGYGPHYCIGANLAYQEAQIALEEIFANYPDLCISPFFSPIYRNSSLVRAMEKMPVFKNKESLISSFSMREKFILFIEKLFKKEN